MANLTVYRGMKLTKDLAQKLEAASREKGSSPSPIDSGSTPISKTQLQCEFE